MANSKLSALGDRGTVLSTDIVYVVNPLTGLFYKATVAELITAIGVGFLEFKGVQDCSGTPNYPAASKGDYYLVSVAGKIGGASGTVVEVGDTFFATADNAGGTQAGVGASWTVMQGNTLRQPSVQTVASAATVTPTSLDDAVVITAQAAALNLANPTGTFGDQQGFTIRIKDNGTARAIAYNAGSGSKYRAIGVTLPTTTVISKTHYLACVYNAADDKFDVLAVSVEA